MKIEERMDKYLIVEASPIERMEKEILKYDKKNEDLKKERKRLSSRLGDLMRAYQQMFKTGKISDEEWSEVQGDISTLMSYV
jgi:hypothetical protein